MTDVLSKLSMSPENLIAAAMLMNVMQRWLCELALQLCSETDMNLYMEAGTSMSTDVEMNMK